ncbi:hypothetical protein [Bradyrhizobium neotropicale]|uniref:Uncharacterized protein n=1 Tax=Bradyrhizobium neotropicale TaxID=1497615 RepID=A0A176YY29_9BRAD|nr:hypothetical protein [Bradyrhizobium neotropicale]OAF12095.1 hypothetical protein AXW67_21165 [Bradyrhizobium neotropicale]
MRAPVPIAALAILLGTPAPSLAQPHAQGAVELSDGTTLSQNPSLPKLNLTNAQREQIRKTVLTEHNDVQFRLKAVQSAKAFTPAVGATLPKGVKAQGLPAQVLSQLPELRDYMYATMKDQVLIVNGMTNKIVDMFSETQPLS